MSNELKNDEGLSLYEQQFVDAYMGDAHGVGSVAIQLIGDANSRSAASIACELMKRPHVRKALRARMENDPLIAGRLERLRFLTRVMRGQENEMRPVRVGKRGTFAVKPVPPSMKDRMDAAEKLARAAGEHLPAIEGDDAAETTKMALAKIAGLSVAELFSIERQRTPDEETRQ